MSRAVVLLIASVAVASAAWDDDAPAYAKEKLAKKQTSGDASVVDKDSDRSLKPTVLADILVYDTKKQDCAGTPGNIGECISSDQSPFIKELYLCDDAGNLLISRCTDNKCQKCAWPRKDDYGYKGPMNQAAEKIGCKDHFLKAQCTNKKPGDIFTLGMKKDEL